MTRGVGFDQVHRTLGVVSAPQQRAPNGQLLPVTILNEALARFTATALEANAPLTVINHPSGLHGFDNQNDDERFREIIRSAIEFMVTHLRLQARP